MASSDRSSPPAPLPPHTFYALLVLSRAPAHGYGIKQEVFQESAGAVDLDPGGLYRLIARMEEQRWVEPAAIPDNETDSRRKYYALTGVGRHALATEAARLTRLARAPEAAALAREGTVG